MAVGGSKAARPKWEGFCSLLFSVGVAVVTKSQWLVGGFRLTGRLVLWFGVELSNRAVGCLVMGEVP